MPKMTAGSSGEEEVGFVEKVTTAWGTVIEQVGFLALAFSYMITLPFLLLQHLTPATASSQIASSMLPESSTQARTSTPRTFIVF